MRRLGHARGAGGAPSFRNPAGVARKVNKFHAAQSGEGPRRVRGARLEAVVWRRFRDDVDELERVAEAIIGGGTSHGSGLGAAPSRGPVPKFGPRLSNLEDGQTCVYLMELRGSVEILFADYAAAGLAVVKAGRSNDARRRVNELNVGFPPTCDLAWALCDERMFDTGQAAHDAERSEYRVSFSSDQATVFQAALGLGAVRYTCLGSSAYPRVSASCPRPRAKMIFSSPPRRRSRSSKSWSRNVRRVSRGPRSTDSRAAPMPSSPVSRHSQCPHGSYRARVRVRSAWRPVCAPFAVLACRPQIQ